MAAPGPAIPSGTREPLRPAFSSDAQALAFSALIAIALAMPVLLAKVHPVGRQYFYDAVREQDGAFSFVRHEIFDVPDDIDILFAGNSTTWAGFDSPTAEAELSKKLGRKARVVTFGSYWPGIDVPYMQIHDALEHKRIRMVVLSVPRTGFNDGPSPVGFRFLSYMDPAETRDDLPLKYRVELYAGYVLRSPRDVLNFLRPIRTIPSPYAAHNGSMYSDGVKAGGAPWREVPEPPRFSAADMIYSAATQGRFRFTGDDPPPYHVIYLQKLARMLAAHGTRLAIVNVPVIADGRSGQAIERDCWPRLVSSPVVLAGVPPSELFRGLTDQQVSGFYYDSVHLNRAGAQYFTRAILPGLFHIFGGSAGGSADGD